MLQNLFEQACFECEEHGPENLANRPPVPRAICPFEHGFRVAVPWSNCFGGPSPAAPRFPGARRYFADTILAGRARYGAIHGWRNGRRNPPEWAVDMLAAHLDKMAREASEAARLLRESKKPAQSRTG